MSAVHSFSPDQRAAALEKANERRVAKAEARRRLFALAAGHHAGRFTQAQVEAARLLAEEPELLAELTAYEFLVAIPRVGDARARRFFRRGRGRDIWPLERIALLTDRQRCLMCAELWRIAEHEQ